LFFRLSVDIFCILEMEVLVEVGWSKQRVFDGISHSDGISGYLIFWYSILRNFRNTSFVLKSYSSLNLRLSRIDIGLSTKQSTYYALQLHHSPLNSSCVEAFSNCSCLDRHEYLALQGTMVVAGLDKSCESCWSCGEMIPLN
jgi:hypothetical protein